MGCLSYADVKDGSLGIPTTPDHRREEQLAQIHLHAKLPQPPLPRRRARNDPLLQCHGRRRHPLVPDRTRRPRAPLQLARHPARKYRRLPQVHDPEPRDGDRREDRESGRGGCGEEGVQYGEFGDGVEFE